MPRRASSALSWTLSLLLIHCMLTVLAASCGGGDEDSSTEGYTGDPLVPDTSGDECEEADGNQNCGTEGDGDADLEEAPPPTYWTPEATKTVNDLVFILVKGEPFFAIGFDTHSNGPWDGVSGPNQCFRDENGVAHGFLDTAAEMNQQAAEAGANFAYIWSVPENQFVTTPQIYGKWSDEWGNSRPKGLDAIPIMVNGGGEADMGGGMAAAEELAAEFIRFRNRTDEWSIENRPLLPPFEEMPWFAWHPTFRMKGGGDGTSEELTAEDATTFARATNMMIGDTYSYVQNRWDGVDAVLMEQKGPKGEGYDEWLARDDADHRGYFSAGWDLAHSLRTKGNPDAVVWMWLQGHAFNDDIGGGICHSGSSDLWAMGPFPTMAYLRKETVSVIAAGATGIIFFGYEYCRPEQADKVRSFMRALSNEEVYKPALTSPRLDLGYDTTNLGEAGWDGKGRVHALVKWHEMNGAAYVIGANPGARATPFSLDFPWTIAKAEILDWETPAFVESSDLVLYDKTLKYVAPIDEGFIIRITPLKEAK